MGKYIYLLISIVFVTVSCKNKQADGKLLIATSANMQFAIEELVDSFTIQTGIVPKLIISSSGKLTAQIKEGAPYHVFISADMKYPTELHNSGHATGPAEIYAYGRLVMWTLYDSKLLNPDSLTSPVIRHIAIANPRMAPYGSAAVQFLQKNKIFDEVKHKLVYGESVSQTNQFILSGSAEIGITAKSVVLSPKIVQKGFWADISGADHDPVAQGIVILKRKDQHAAEAKSFYDFIFSEQSQGILEKYGYIVSKQKHE